MEKNKDHYVVIVGLVDGVTRENNDVGVSMVSFCSRLHDQDGIVYIADDCGGHLNDACNP